jgi:acetyltransferase-like isoleucine patch superfamily enzyme
VNLGTLIIGDDVELSSRPVQSHLVVGRGAELRIGNGVRIGTGAGLATERQIVVGDGSTLGAFCLLMDSDYHVAGNASVAPEPKPIHIGNGVRIGHRVVVLPGARIGDGAVVAPASVVSGEIPANAVVAGNPARARLDTDPSSNDDEPGPVVAAVVQRALGLGRLPRLDEGPDQIREWDSLGALRVLLALEERFGITLSEDELRKARSVSDLVECVEARSSRGAAA